MRAARGLVEACHAGPTALVTAFAAAAAASSGLTAARTVLLALAVLTGQLSVGWLNDWRDAAADRAAGRPDKPVVQGLVSATAVGRAFAAAAVAVVPLSLALGARAGVAHLVAVGSAWAYDVRLKTTRLSWLPYAVSFGLLPVVAAGALPGAPAPASPAITLAALMGVAAHLTNGVKDMSADALTGVRGLPQRLGVNGATVVSALLATCAGAVLLVWRPGVVTAAATLVTAAVATTAVARARAGSSPTLFRLSMAASGPLAAGLVLTGGVR